MRTSSGRPSNIHSISIMAETTQAEQKGLYCSTAGSYFTDKDALADHYKSEFHRYWKGFYTSDRTSPLYRCRVRLSVW